MCDNGSYKGVIKREAVYKCTNKDYLPEASQVKCIAHERSECRQGIYKFLYIIRRAINRNLLDAKILFIYAACYKVI